MKKENRGGPGPVNYGLKYIFESNSQHSLKACLYRLPVNYGLKYIFESNSQQDAERSTRFAACELWTKVHF